MATSWELHWHLVFCFAQLGKPVQIVAEIAGHLARLVLIHFFPCSSHLLEEVDLSRSGNKGKQSKVLFSPWPKSPLKYDESMISSVRRLRLDGGRTFPSRCEQSAARQVRLVIVAACRQSYRLLTAPPEHKGWSWSQYNLKKIVVRYTNYKTNSVIE